MVEKKSLHLLGFRVADFLALGLVEAERTFRGAGPLQATFLAALFVVPTSRDLHVVVVVVLMSVVVVIARLNIEIWLRQGVGQGDQTQEPKRGCLSSESN